MEKLSLEKFQDAKIENSQLSYVYAGACTGGGSSFQTIQDGLRTYEVTISWECDETGPSGCLLCAGDITYYGWHRTVRQTSSYSNCG